VIMGSSHRCDFVEFSLNLGMAAPEDSRCSTLESNIRDEDVQCIEHLLHLDVSIFKIVACRFDQNMLLSHLESLVATLQAEPRLQPIRLRKCDNSADLMQSVPIWLPFVDVQSLVCLSGLNQSFHSTTSSEEFWRPALWCEWRAMVQLFMPRDAAHRYAEGRDALLQFSCAEYARRMTSGVLEPQLVRRLCHTDFIRSSKRLDGDAWEAWTRHKFTRNLARAQIPLFVQNAYHADHPEEWRVPAKYNLLVELYCGDAEVVNGVFAFTMNYGVLQGPLRAEIPPGRVKLPIADMFELRLSLTVLRVEDGRTMCICKNVMPDDSGPDHVSFDASWFGGLTPNPLVLSGVASGTPLVPSLSHELEDYDYILRMEGVTFPEEEEDADGDLGIVGFRAISVGVTRGQPGRQELSSYRLQLIHKIWHELGDWV